MDNVGTREATPGTYPAIRGAAAIYGTYQGRGVGGYRAIPLCAEIVRIFFVVIGMRQKKPKPYRENINAFKHGIGLFYSWQPETFRELVNGMRAAVVMDIIGVIGLVVYLIVKYFK